MLKNLLLLTGILATASVSAQTNYPGAIPGCIARYSFAGVTGTVSDVSGNGNNGTAYNLATTAGWRKAANAAVKFDGSSSYIQVPDASMLRPQQMTTVALVRHDGFYSGNCQGNQILSKGYPAYNNGVYGMGSTDNVYDNSCATFTPTQDMRADYVGNNSLAMQQTSPIQTGKWYFMASSFDGSTYSVYQTIMDSTAMLTSISPVFTIPNVPSALGTNTQDITIGKHADPAFPYWFNGAMDEVVLFNRALSSQEIYKVYTYLFNGYALGVAHTEAARNEVNAVVKNGRLLLQSFDGERVGEVIVYNVAGQVVVNKSFNENTAEADLSGLAPQVLYLKIARKNTVSILKVSNL